MGARVTKDLQNVTPNHLRIDELHETGRELGDGSYGTVTEVRYKGTLCACKRVHSILVGEGGDGRVVERFQAECKRMSKLRHPNIVQFLGIYFERPSSLPALVMELLPLSLDALLKNYKDVPYYIKISILLDVSLALLFLHKQSPPIMHRDLSVYNVLLTHSLRAKLSDLGVSRDLLSLTQREDAPPLSIAPGNMVYMPPEALKANPSYGLSLDVYSFGQLIVHVVRGRCPDEKRLGSEGAEGQEEVEEIAEGPMKRLARRCLKEDPVRRPATAEIVVDMEQERERNPVPFRHLMDLLHSRKEGKKDAKEKKEENGVEGVQYPPAEPALRAAAERRLQIPPTCSLEKEGVEGGHSNPVVVVTAAQAQTNSERRPNGTHTYLPSTSTAAPLHQATFHGNQTTLPLPKPRRRPYISGNILPPRTTNPAPTIPHNHPSTLTTPTVPQTPPAALQPPPTVHQAPHTAPQPPPTAPPNVPQTMPTVYPYPPIGLGYSILEALGHSAVTSPPPTVLEAPSHSAVTPPPTALALLPLASEPTALEPVLLPFSPVPQPAPPPVSPAPQPAPPPFVPAPQPAPPPFSPAPQPAPPPFSPAPQPAPPPFSPAPQPAPHPFSPAPQPAPPPFSPAPQPAPHPFSPAPQSAPPPFSPAPQPAPPPFSPAPPPFSPAPQPIPPRFSPVPQPAPPPFSPVPQPAPPTFSPVPQPAPPPVSPVPQPAPPPFSPAPQPAPPPFSPVPISCNQSSTLPRFSSRPHSVIMDTPVLRVRDREEVLEMRERLNTLPRPRKKPVARPNRSQSQIEDQGPAKGATSELAKKLATRRGWEKTENHT